MFYDLKWRFGFGWFSVWLLILFVANVNSTTGFLKIVLILFSAITFFYMVYKYRKWNGSDWRKIHFRGMLLFSQLAEMEMATAKDERRDYDLKEVCRQLGIGICGKDKEINVNAMIEELYEENGGYCVRLIETFCPDHLILSDTLKLASKIDFSPQLVMCNIIENTYGEEEAIKYIEALICGKAH